MEQHWLGLLKGEADLTLSIALGLVFGAVIIKTGLADRIMKRLMPWLRRAGIGAVLCMAMTISFGSAKAGAALLASALAEERISERSAKWGTLMLAFPAYLRRWPSTFIMAASLAGVSGVIFSVVILLRAAAKFIILLLIIRSGGRDDREFAAVGTQESVRGMKFDWFKMLKLMPLAWFFFAVAYMLVPQAEELMRRWLLGGTYLPVAGLAVAAASIAHVSAALALAGGGLSSGQLSVAQAVFALILGNSLGIVSRMVRQNAGYYFGLFQSGLAKSMLIWNFTITGSLSLLTVIAAALPLLI